MFNNVKILVDDKVIFEENCENVNLNIDRKVTTLYRVGETTPYDLAPSAVNRVILTGKFLKKPDGNFTMEE